MSNVYILDAVSEKVIRDLNDVNAHEYDLQELEGNMGLDTLIGDLLVPGFFQYCENRNFGTDNELELKCALKTFVDYIHRILLDRLIPDYDPEEDLL